MRYENESQARRTKIKGHDFTAHLVVSLARDYEMITSREAFYEMTCAMQKVIIRQMLPYAIEYHASLNG